MKNATRVQGGRPDLTGVITHPIARVGRHRWLAITTVIVVLSLATGALSVVGPSGRAGASRAPNTALSPVQARIAAVAKEAMAKYDLRALIVRVTTKGRNTYTGALGESMTGVPATTKMHIRNGFIAYSYLTTMLMKFVDLKKISLNDKLSKYFPDLPEANAITIKMLATSTSGYADYVYQPAVTDAVLLHPYQQWTTAELVKIGTSAPPTFAPGTNFKYSHTNYAILGMVLAKVGRKPLGQLMKQYIFKPMGLTNTQGSSTPQIPTPVLHTFSSERREILGVPATTPFYEDSTFWNPSWSAPEGAVQTTDIADLTTSIAAIGSGALLSRRSYQEQVSPNPYQKSFGMAVILRGSWITGNKFYAGSGAAFGYLPSRRLAMAVITTYQPSAFNGQGDVTDAGMKIMTALSKAVAPSSPIPG